MCHPVTPAPWGHTVARQRHSPALQVAEVQQVELPAVLAVVDVVHVLSEGTDTRTELSTSSWEGLRCLRASKSPLATKAAKPQPQPWDVTSWSKGTHPAPMGPAAHPLDLLAEDKAVVIT